MSDEPRATRLVVVTTAKSPFEAQVIAAVLRGAEIPVYVGGSMLSDEFAASQRLIGLGGVRVQVPSDRLADAQLALDDARDAGVALEAEMTEADQLVPAAPSPVPMAPEPAARFSSWNWGVIAVFSMLLVQRWAFSASPTPDYGPFVYEATDQGHRFRWKKNGVLAREVIDADGLPEVTHFYNLEGVRTYSGYDSDGDGVVERGVTYAPDGSVATTSFDADGDGRCERWQEHHAGGLRIWLDLDGDGRFDRIEERNAVDQLLRAWRVDKDAGFVAER